MNQDLKSYIPVQAYNLVREVLDDVPFKKKKKKERKTRHGDYRKLKNGTHQITVNANLNPYRFLITLLHEIAHYKCYKNYGYNIKPHGKAWKTTFQHIMLPFINPKIFPESLLPILANHFKNPKASSDTDESLSLALKAFDISNEKTYIFEVKDGATFTISNGSSYRKIKKRRKRYECQALDTGRLYAFSPLAEVELINDENE